MIRPLAQAARAVLQQALLLAAIAVAVFLLIRVVPGDVVDSMALEGSLDDEAIAALRAEMGLDADIATQFRLWAGRALSGDLGLSLRFERPVTELILAALPTTLTLAALAPRPGQILWDVGSGSGSIAVEWCRAAPGCRAVAFETDPARRDRIAANARSFGVEVEVRAEAPGDFAGAESPDTIFIGGGLGTDSLVDECLAQISGGGRLVANAVTAESEAILVHWHSRLGGELRRFQHYQGEPLGGYTGWRPQMPITQWTVTLL